MGLTGAQYSRSSSTVTCAQTFPHVRCCHSLTHDVGKIGRNMEEAAGANGGIVNQGDVADRGADARSENAQPRKALLLKPAQAAARVLDRLAVRLKSKADIGAYKLVGTLVPLGHAAVVVRQAHFEGADADTLQPVP